MLGLAGIGALSGAVVGSFLEVPDSAIPLLKIG
jgi:hypothetical protein